MNGFVSFVSSGPGDPELLTLRAVERLRPSTSSVSKPLQIAALAR